MVKTMFWATHAPAGATFLATFATIGATILATNASTRVMFRAECRNILFLLKEKESFYKTNWFLKLIEPKKARK